MMSDERTDCKHCMALEAEVEKLLDDMEALLQNMQRELAEAKPKNHLAVVHDIRENHKEPSDET